MTSLPDPSLANGGLNGELSRRDWWLVGLLFLVWMVSWIDRILLGVLIEPIRLDLGLSDIEIGLITGPAFALTYVAGGLFFAIWADRGNRRHLLALAVGVWSVATLLCGSAANFVQLFVLRMFVGVGEAGSLPAIMSIVPERIAAPRRAFVMSLIFSGGSAGLLLGAALAGTVADHWGWRAAFPIFGVAGLMLAMLLLFSVPETRRPEAARSAAILGDFGVGLRAIFAVRTSRLMMLGYAVMSLFAAGLLYWVPAFLLRHHSMSLSAAGAWFGVTNGVGMLVGTLGGGILVDRLVARDMRWMIRFPALTIGGSVLLYLVAFAAPQTSIALVSLFVASVVCASSGGASFGAIQSVLPPDVRGMSGAVLGGLVTLIGMGAASLAIGGLSEVYGVWFGGSGLRAALVTMTLFGLPGAALMWSSSASMMRDLTAAEADDIVARSEPAPAQAVRQELSI